MTRRGARMTRQGPRLARQRTDPEAEAGWARWAPDENDPMPDKNGLARDKNDSTQDRNGPAENKNDPASGNNGPAAGCRGPKSASRSRLPRRFVLQTVATTPLRNRRHAITPNPAPISYMRYARTSRMQLNVLPRQYPNANPLDRFFPLQPHLALLWQQTVPPRQCPNANPLDRFSPCSRI